MIVVEVSRQWSIRGPSKEDPAGKAENKKSRRNDEKLYSFPLEPSSRKRLSTKNLQRATSIDSPLTVCLIIADTAEPAAFLPIQEPRCKHAGNPYKKTRPLHATEEIARHSANNKLRNPFTRQAIKHPTYHPPYPRTSMPRFPPCPSPQPRPS